MKKPLVDIIILNWNDLDNTVLCIQSLQKINYANYKIIVVDNGSKDNSVKLLKNKFKNIKILETHKNLGFSGGCNKGIKYSLKEKAEFILLLNNDTLVKKNFLTILVNSALKDNQAGIVSPLIYYASKPDIIWATGAYKNKRSRFGYIDYGYQKKDKGQYKSIQEVDCVWGCCMLIKKEVFENVGHFDDDYFLYSEDIDFCYRVRKKNYKILFSPEAKIWHKVSGASGGEGNIIKDYYNTRNLILFATKNLSGKEKNYYYFFILLDSLRSIYFYTKELKYGNISAVLKALYHGYSNRIGFYKI